MTVLSKILKKKSFKTVISEKFWNYYYAKTGKNILSPLIRRIVRMADGFIAVSRRLKDILLADGICPEQVYYIPNGVKYSPDCPAKPALRQKLGLPLERVIVLFSGRLHQEKDLPFLLESWRMIPEMHAHSLLLLGDGPERPQIQAFVAEHDPAGSVVCRGYVDNVEEYMAAADIFVLPSRLEGCSNALLEAMSAGLACVATASPGNDEVIIDGENGRLVRFGDKNGLALCLKQLIADTGLRCRLGHCARETIKNNFTVERAREEYLNCYRKIRNSDKTNG